MMSIVGCDQELADVAQDDFDLVLGQQLSRKDGQNEIRSAGSQRLALGHHRLERVAGMANAKRVEEQTIPLEVLGIVVKQDVADVEKDPVDHASLMRSIWLSIIHESQASCSSLISSSAVD